MNIISKYLINKLPKLSLSTSIALGNSNIVPTRKSMINQYTARYAFSSTPSTSSVTPSTNKAKQ